jgi:hypothetical protein
MKIGDREKFCYSLANPIFTFDPLTFRAVTVTAGVV